jgi:hypothetical protein
LSEDGHGLFFRHALRVLLDAICQSAPLK